MTEVDLNEYIFHPAPVVSLPVRGLAERFPVHRIFCVGRNYADHAREMGHDPDREPPFFFTKPPEAVVPPGAALPYPSATRDLHHEVELVVALAGGGRNLTTDSALDLVYGYAVGVDLTRRDLQAEAKKLGRPWDSAKAFAGSAPCSEIVPVERIGHPTKGRIALSVGGQLRQDGDLAQMIWKTPEILTELSKLWTLAPGDLIFTGTPAGVGPLQVGAQIACEIESVGRLDATLLGSGGASD
ncbi:fumarylacetoacetate hydrolase family protein [Algihabitans albus]|uniref:fumarylacetoacetate hydrolase family protein n=1 Tax=Algihabitans albus TaxID=2164067 RepID=UPI000E5D669E|nr:fumarylacetoacetate hydrolase family protein [Algihabitans albus]